MNAELDIRDVGYEIRGTRLLESVSLRVRPGTLLAIVGPNGAGKSTFLKLLAGTLRGEGAVFLGDASLAAMTRKARAKTVAFVPADDAPIDGLTVGDVVAEGRFAHRRHALDDGPEHARAVDAALDRVGLGAFRNRPFRELSSGERRRAWIALGLAQEAPILILDEPTAHLDFRYAQQTLRIMREIANAGRCVITVLHDLNEAAQVADQIALVDRGRVACSGPPERVLTPATISRVYGVDCEVVTTSGASIRIFAIA